MKNSPGSLFNTLFSVGSRPGMNEWELRKLWLLNSFYHVGHLVLIAALTETYIVEGVQSGNLLLSMCLLFECGFLALVLKRLRISEFMFLFSINVILFIMNNLYGRDGGIYLFYFPFLLVVAFTVDIRNWIAAVFHVLFTSILIICGFVFEHRLFYHVYSREILDSSYLSNFIISSFAMGIIALLIVRMSYLQYRRFNDHVTERQQSENQMRSVIREKETLLAEVHHRVKNNLAVITSLLNLQMNAVRDDYTRDVLREIRNRVGSMSLIHQKLYQHKNAEMIDFGNYAEALVNEIEGSYSHQIAASISVRIDAEHVSIPLTTAVPCGLILNETLSNCYKHAFNGRQSGIITIRFQRDVSDAHRLTLEVKDDGTGLDESIDLGQATSLGLTIISSLADQLDAKWELKNVLPNGTGFTMSFIIPEPNQKA